MKLGKEQGKKPAGMALAALAGEDDPSSTLTFEEVLGRQRFEKYLPVDEEAINRGVEQFRGHIKNVLHQADSDELEKLCGCLGFSQEEIRKWEQEEKKEKETAARGSRLVDQAERAFREAEQRRKQERERAERELAMQRSRLLQQNEAIQQARDRVLPRGPPGPAPFGKGQQPGKGMVKGGMPPSARGPPPPGHPMMMKGKGMKGGPMPRGMVPPRGPAPNGAGQVPSSGLSPPEQAGQAQPPPPQPARQPPTPSLAPSPVAAPVAPQAAAAAAAAAPKAAETVETKNALFMSDLKDKPVKVTKKDIERYAAQLDGEVAKMRAQVTEELNDRYRKAVAETNTLQDVKKELSVVDQIIAVDVAVIREKIDTAASELHDAQKRFDAAEQEFIAAKLEIKMCEEYKNELTEYLTLLIQENQKQKTAKLEELSAALHSAGKLTEAGRQVLDMAKESAAVAAESAKAVAASVSAAADALLPPKNVSFNGDPGDASSDTPID